jgi:hypothetical protein
MEIVKESSALLSNYEVLQFLKLQKAEISSSGNKKKKAKDRLYMLAVEVSKYLGTVTKHITKIQVQTSSFKAWFWLV